MYNVLEVISLLLKFSRIFGLAPYSQREQFFIKSNFWRYYSYLAFLLNFLLQLYNFERLIADYKFKPTIENIAWACSTITSRLNSIISIVPIMYNNCVIEELLHFLNKNLFKNNNIRIYKKDFEKFKFSIHILSVICFVIATTLPAIQIFCYFNSWQLTFFNQIITSFSFLVRTLITIAVFGQFITFISLCQFCIQTINSNICHQNFNNSKKKLIHYGRHYLYFLKELKLIDFQLKIFGEKIVNIYGIFICLLGIGAIAETIHELTFNLILSKKLTCQGGLSYYWISYFWLMLIGILSSLVSLKISVSLIFKLY